MIANIYKPVQWTSFDVVKKIRNISKEKKVGHAGTLDPFAEGVLVIGTGKDTKSLTEISGTDKTYEAVLKLGSATDTMDSEGTTTEVDPIPEITENEINQVFSKFVGNLEQIPPMYSAKKVNGIRLYKLARKNQVVHREPVSIVIYKLQLLSYKKPILKFSVHCSKGTYVRVLGNDIAKELGTVGHLIQLIRTSVGKFTIKESQTIDEFSNTWSSIII